jgi:iron complex outermembrane receptor protein
MTDCSRQHLASALSAAIALLLLPDAWAQATSPKPAPHAAESTLFEMGTVEIRSTAIGPLPARKVLTSVDAIGGGVVQSDGVRNTWELFRRTPGILLTNFNQGTTSGKLSLRGFNGEGEVNAVKLLIDGIPSNSNDGNMPYIDLLMPLEIDTITTVRGTNDARFGLHNIAGNVDITTRQGGSDTDVRVGLGSFGLRDVQAFKGIEGETWAQNYFVGARHSDGHRVHSESDKLTLAGKWFYQPSASSWRVGLIARHHGSDALEAGYLSAAQAASDPDQSPAHVQNDGGERRIDQLSVHASGAMADSFSWQAKAYVNQFFDQRWVRFSAAESQQERLTDETQRGLRLTASWRPSVSGLSSLAVEGGLDTERQRNCSERYATDARVRSSQTRHQVWSFDTTGAFVQALIKPWTTLSVTPGYRVDRISGQFTNVRVPATYPINDYGNIGQPKLSAVWTPVTGHSVYGNWGRTFQVGVGSASFKIPPRTSDLQASVNEGWEAGWKFLPQSGLAGLNGRMAVWQQNASDEVMRRLNDSSGDSDNIGSTRRRGVDLQLKASASKSVETWLTYQRQKAVIITPDPSAPLTQGKEVDHVPNYLYGVGADWRVSPGVSLNTSLSGQGSYQLTRLNDKGRFGKQMLLNVGATWQVTPGSELSAQIKNLSNRYTEYVWWDTTALRSQHSPGEPRALYLAWRMSL